MRNDKAMITNAVLGLAVADAVGVPYEFLSREEIEWDPATDMVEYGTHHQPKGTWSDDTSLALALVDALAKSGEEIDYRLLADSFAAWVQKAAFTAHGEVVDIGGTCSRAIRAHLDYPDLAPWDCGVKSEQACGNGGLMRILPLVFWLDAKYGEDFIGEPEAREEICRVTAVTHANACCALACLIYCAFAGRLLCGDEPMEAWKRTAERMREIAAEDAWLQTAADKYGRLLDEGFARTPVRELSGSGYVVHTLESAVWCFLNTEDYRSCVLEAVNLGEDTDTTAAVAGGLAGLYYGDSGERGIPQDWLGALAKRDWIASLCGALGGRLEQF